MKLKLTIFTFLTAWVLCGFAVQPEVDGFDKLTQKDYSKARKVFAGLLKANPENAAALFGLGECCYFDGKLDSAKIYYQKGMAASSSFAGNYAGLGKLSMASNPVEADTYFKDAVKKSKKDATGLVTIARAYFDANPKNLAEAKRYVTLAIGVDAKNASAYYLNGLIELEKKNNSEASLQFDRTIYYNPNFLQAYLNRADIMIKARNYTAAVDAFNKALAIDPQFWIAYKKMGEMYYDNQKYSDAAKSFGTYFQNVTNDKDVTHYAYSLFFDKQYDAARKLIDNLVKENPNDYVLLRLLGYISYGTEDYSSGIGYMEKLFGLVPQDKILKDDYSYYGKMLAQTGKDSLAIVYFKNAVEKDSSDYQLFDDIASSYKKLKKFDDYLDYSSRFMAKKPIMAIGDYFKLGQAFYSVASALDVKTDSLKQNQYLQRADSLFLKVETNAPTSYLGPLWRARVNSAIDKETTMGLAKPFYEKAEGLMTDSTKYKKELSEIYSYMGYYYYQKEDKANSIEFWKKLLGIDPENAAAQQAIKALEKK